MEKYLEQLNDSQRKAVLYNEGPSLVVAGAGSGKTRVLTYKIAHLLQNGYQPHSILALTFTNKAAREMKERIASITDEYVTRYLWMGTFHSIFYKILRREAAHIGFPADFTIYDAADSKNLIKTIIKELQLDDKIYRPGLIQSRISNAKNSLITCQAYQQNGKLLEHDTLKGISQTYRIYNIYQNRCFKAGVMDFDELLMETNILFRDHADVLQKYQQQFKYVLVDEYQDTNFAQHLIVRRLCEKHHKIFVVGDDAQSIYSFRGANIDNMLRFEETYPDFRIFRLERNYRSTQNIVEAANSLIKKNEGQIPKNVYSEKEKGSKVAVISSYSDIEEAYIVAARILEMKRLKGYENADFAVLYRTNAQSRILEDTFRKRSIPYRVYGSQSFYQRKEIKDVLAYLRVIVNPRDEESLRRIINYPARGIGGTTLEKLQSAANELNISLWDVVCAPSKYVNTLNKRTLGKIGAFCELISGFISEKDDVNVFEITEYVIKKSGMRDVLFDDNSIEGMSRIENVQELMKATKEFVSLRQQEGSEDVMLSDFLMEVSLMTDQDTDNDANADKVTMMTVHSAKGLEFQNVFIVGMENMLFPSALSMDSPRAIEEERRLFYVAITRAKENCIITYSKNRFRNGQTTSSSPSFFIADIGEQYLDFEEDIELPSVRRQEVASSRSYFSDSSFSRPATNLSHFGNSNPTPSRTSRYSKISDNERVIPSSDAPAEKVTSFAGFTVGDKVVHASFGEGVIESFEGKGSDARTIVAFKNSGTKTLLMKYAKLLKI